MKPDIKLKWIKALTSGRYHQATGALKCSDDAEQVGYCCLGVLCDLAREAGLGEWQEGSYNGRCSRFLGSEGTLPQTVMEWAGLSEPDPMVPVPREGMQRLSAVNDAQRGFSEIAGLVSEWL